MISANNVTLRVGKTLFEEVNIKFTEGNCYGLIGANGSRKIYVFEDLSGQLERRTVKWRSLRESVFLSYSRIILNMMNIRFLIR